MTNQQIIDDWFSKKENTDNIPYIKVLANGYVEVFNGVSMVLMSPSAYEKYLKIFNERMKSLLI